MAPVNRRSFLAGLITAPVLAAIAVMHAKPERQIEEMRPITDWLGAGYETPNGETVTAMHEIHGRLYVFTRTSVYVVPAHG